jgi:ketopantoate reductase
MPTQAEKRARALAALANVPTYAERLALVKTAIDDLLVTGQSTSYEGRSLTFSNLSELRKLEIEYENKAAEELAKTAGRSRVYYVTPIT